MATAFTKFLRELADREAAQAETGKSTIAEWQTAIEDLFAQLRSWLKAADPEGIINIEEGQQDIREPGLGRYRVPRLNLRVFNQQIFIIPKARRTIGTAHPPQRATPARASGRVDITDELKRYILYRFHEDGRDAWVIDDLESEPKPLDQDAFERALMSYLR